MKGFATIGILTVTLMGASVGIAGAAAVNDPMIPYYGNTVMSMNQPLYMMRTWFNPDHTFMQFRGSNETPKEYSYMPRLAGWRGTWEIQGDQLCLTYGHQPAPGSITTPTGDYGTGCHPIGNHKLGDVWKVTYQDGPYKGTTEIYTIVRGHDTQP